ncbi:diacylglycerol kinase family protein [Candidatus Electrothrix sp.]|uniref:diacylglycerol kinase family protein n=2 Tax=Candidatus Electrothrix sp. TaxID=2170559 RepID=UPI0040577E86
MKFGIIYFLTGILAILSAYSFWPGLCSVLCLWTALSLLCVSIAYFTNNPGIFRKKSNGRIPFCIKFAFIPFLLIIHSYNKIARDLDKVPSIQRISDNLFIGDRVTPSDAPVLREKKILAMLDVTAEFEPLNWAASFENISYLNIPVLDHAIPSEEELIQSIIWIKNQQTYKGPVLVNCALGRGRSALVIAAFLLSQTRNNDVTDVLEHLKILRKTIRLNKRQRKLLMKVIKHEQFSALPKAWIIANPVAGKGKWREYKEQIIEELSSHYLLTIKESSETESATSLAEEAVAADPGTIIACGGDGTVSEVAAAVVNTDNKLGIIPLGTTNALCHVLMGIKVKFLPVEVACSYITAGHTRVIDTAECNGRLVLLLVGLGFEQKMISSAGRQEKNEYGQLAYLMGLWQAVQQNELLKMTITVDGGKPFTLETTSLVVANAAPLTTILAQGNGEPDFLDGLLDITWINTESGGGIMGLLELSIAGMLSVNPGPSVNHVRAQHVQITVEPPRNYVIDGEVYPSEDLDISISPESLAVYC